MSPKTARDFYRNTLETLEAAQIPVLIGGAFAQEYFTGISRDTKDLDLFLMESDLKNALDALGRRGNYYLIQFGHNDESKDKTDRYTPPADYRANLERFVRETRAKNAYPVLMTPVMRRRFDKDGVFRDSHGEYPDIVRSVASDLRVPMIDMHRKTEALLQLFGPQASSALFLQLPPGENDNYPRGIQDNTHFSPFGARIVASLAVEGIREAGLGLVSSFKKMQPPLPAPAQSSPSSR